MRQAGSAPERKSGLCDRVPRAETAYRGVLRGAGRPGSGAPARPVSLELLRELGSTWTPAAQDIPRGSFSPEGGHLFGSLRVPQPPLEAPQTFLETPRCVPGAGKSAQGSCPSRPLTVPATGTHVLLLGPQGLLLVPKVSPN